MKRVVFSVGMICLSSMNVFSEVGEQKPNIVLFLADDCTYRDIACYGSENSLTPHIDNFSREGMLFTNCYQAVPMSSPTRHNLYTGLWPVKSGAYPNHTFANKDVKSVVHQLHPMGYKVALIGKSHVAPESVFPFDLYVPSLDKGDLDFEAVKRFIDQCKKENTPFCLYVCSNEPHSPWSKGDTSLFDKDKIKLPKYYVDIDETRKMFVKYLAEVNYMDSQFGNLLKIIDAKNMKDNSVVFFLSEQGNDFPFAKWTCYDAGVHSACIVRWPGKIKCNTVSDAIVEYVDIVPTFVDIAEGKPIIPMDGKSFLPVLKMEAKEHKEYTYSIQTSRGIISGGPYYGIRSVADKKYRYVVNLTPEETFSCYSVKRAYFKEWVEIAKSDNKARFLTEKYQRRPAVEFYDIKNDPDCMINLADNPKYKDIMKKYAVQLASWMAECGDKGQETELDAWSHMFNDKSGWKKKLNQ